MTQAPAALNAQATLNAAGLGASRNALLVALKRGGAATVPVLADVVGLNVETVRAHLKVLAGQGLVERHGTRSDGPGRPEVVFRLAPAAESLFPRREGEVLRELATFLQTTGSGQLLDAFFDRYIQGRRREALARVRGLEGRERLVEAARILSEQGFMAVVEEDVGAPRLRLCHCPLRELVEVSSVPCRAEVGFLRELLGQGLARESYIPAGDASCSYAAGGTNTRGATAGAAC